ncbi:MAG: phosphohydrolase [Epulopiscium sp. Nuni2H_MBin003]|nr:MAG: phosphohydrolase [Epulopiscium sp. Nuni2H_MBin003]
MDIIADFKPSTQIKGYYIAKNKQILKNKNGKDYQALKLQDASGIVDAKIWIFHSSIGEYESEQIVYVEGEVTVFLEQLQLNVFKIRLATPQEYELKNLIPHTKKNVDELEESLYSFIESVQNEDLKKLLESIFYDEEINNQFLNKPAAKSVHHAYLNGLLEHTISTTKLGDFLAKQYDYVNRDLVIAGCLLHDIGKIKELSGYPQNEYTDDGQMIGHVVLGYQMVMERVATFDEFNKDTALLIGHILISHHGEQEYGSPEVPKCIEGMIVHLADYTDSRAKMMEELLSNAQEQKYTGFNKVLNRNIRNTNYVQQ